MSELIFKPGTPLSDAISQTLDQQIVLLERILKGDLEYLEKLESLTPQQSEYVSMIKEKLSEVENYRKTNVV